MATTASGKKMDQTQPPPGPSLLELKTIYEGPGGNKAKRFLKKTTLIVTNRTVEIEREGANVLLTFITLGCWYMFFQTASIEIYEVRAVLVDVYRVNSSHAFCRSLQGFRD
jgi:hypothetical protein